MDLSSIFGSGMGSNLRDATQAASAARDSANRAGDAVQRVRDLQIRLDHLTLACAALWSLLKE